MTKTVYLSLWRFDRLSSQKQTASLKSLYIYSFCRIITCVLISHTISDAFLCRSRIMTVLLSTSRACYRVLQSFQPSHVINVPQSEPF